MDFSFTTLRASLTDSSVATLVQTLRDAGYSEYAGWLVFVQPLVSERFITNLTALTSPTTLPPDFLSQHHATVLAMSIDGDYILANDTTTFVIEKSLLKADMECYPLPPIDFFVAYEQQQIISAILPTPSSRRI